MSNITDQIRAERAERLMPGGVPRYIRVWDNGGRSYDQYTVVFTKKSLAPGIFMYIGMSDNPCSPMGFGQHGELHQKHQGKHLGKRIKFSDLPVDCQRVVIDDYKDLWDI